MEKQFFRYQILRYIADLRRMEPENMGIIVQNDQGVSCRFQTHLGSRRGFDYENYRLWREFFEAEINGTSVPIFQPERTDVKFLEYLQERCSGNYSLTRPLDLVLKTYQLTTAQDYLFRTLVLKPDETQESVRQPVQKLRYELTQRRILNDPAFHTKELLTINGLTEFVEYFYTRNAKTALPVIVQPVQFLPDISRTINAMERAEALISNLRKAKVQAKVSVVVDEVPAPTSKDKDTRKWAYDRIQQGKKELRQLDAEVIDTTPGTIRLADSIERDLKEIENTLPQTTIAYS